MQFSPHSLQPGRLKSVKALGWYLAEENIAQVSMNLCDYEVTPLHTAFEECSKDARVREKDGTSFRTKPCFVCVCVCAAVVECYSVAMIVNVSLQANQHHSMYSV